MTFPLSKFDILVDIVCIPDVVESILKWDTAYVDHQNVLTSLKGFHGISTNIGMIYAARSFFHSCLLIGESVLPVVAAPRGLNCYNIQGCNDTNSNYIRFVRNWVLSKLIEIYIISLTLTQFTTKLLETFTTPLTKKIVMSQMTFIVDYVRELSDSDEE
jgi:hypothetical protein